jgi:hypothetical protein
MILAFLTLVLLAPIYAIALWLIVFLVGKVVNLVLKKIN